MKIEKLQGDYPYDLLLLADESEKAINEYIHTCEVYEVLENEERIGVFVIEPIDPTTIEIKNIAIRPSDQGKGFGKQVIEWIDQVFSEKGIDEVIVGTGDASIFQLLFYQKCGFEMDTIRKNFFIDNYDKPIWENGVRLKHMIVLKKAIK